MKPKRPTETDLLALVQNGFNAQLPKDREAQAPAAGAAPKPKVEGTSTPEPAPFVPMVRITLTIPEELRYRLKMILINHGRTARGRMTQDEYCAMAIANRLDLDENIEGTRNRTSPLEAFLQDCLEGGGLTKEWAPKAKGLLKGLTDDPCPQPKPPRPARGKASPAPTPES